MDGFKVGTPVEFQALSALAERSAVQMRSENFPVALRLLPRTPRTELICVYLFARFVDDIGDEAAGDRSALLTLVEADVRALPDGLARLAPVLGLRSVLSGHRMPIEPLLDLVRANQQDQTITRYQSFEDLLQYCRLSAAPIGNAVLHIADAATPANVADSDSVCAALQVLEHCQDVAEDARVGRIYLPVEDLRAAGVPESALLADTTSSPLRSVIMNQVDRASELLQPGRRLVRGLTGWSRLAVSGYVAGGLATVSALRDADFDVLARPVAPAKLSTAAHAARLMTGR